jgi:hypothetical protein
MRFSKKVGPIGRIQRLGEIHDGVEFGFQQTTPLFSKSGFTRNNFSPKSPNLLSPTLQGTRAAARKPSRIRTIPPPAINCR